MNVEIGAGAALFPEKEYRNGVQFCKFLSIFFNLSHETCSPFNVRFKPADPLEGFGDEAVHVDHDGRVVHGGRLHSQLPLLQQTLVLEQKIFSHSYFKKCLE
jgi:hypothetical protein